jgi:hypothetical protein
MVRRWGICLGFALLMIAAIPAGAFGVTSSDAMPISGSTDAGGSAAVTPATTYYGPPFAFRVEGVVNGMTYYEPVTFRVIVSGPIDIPPGPSSQIDGSDTYPGQVISSIGVHTLVMNATSLGVPKTASLTFTIAPPPQPWLKPVYRFYRPGMGTHFYTATTAERDSVVVNLGGTFSYEGVAYWSDPDYNMQPLYRFLRPSTGTHFYTASDAEMQSVRANLSGTYTFEGPAYNVSSAPVEPPCATVYRFYNPRNGTHFYTASDSERDSVINTLSSVYHYEGPAYFLAQ